VNVPVDVSAGWAGRPRGWATSGILIALLALAALYVGLFALGDLLAHVNAFLVLQVLIFAAYAALAYLILRDRRTLDVSWFILAATGIAALLLLRRTTVSSDMYRYLWDGWLLKSGFNPYLILPVDPRLASFQASDLFRSLYWTNEYTPYPPVAQLIFVAAHTAYAALGLPAAKLVLSFPVVLLAALLYHTMERRWFVLFILNPLVLFETFHGGHIDSWAALFAFLAYRAFVTDNLLLSAGLLGLGALTKVFPAIFLPLFVVDLVKRQRRRDALVYAAVFGGVVAAGYLPFILTSPLPVLRLFSFARTFHFNAPVFSFVTRTLAALGADSTEETALRLCGLALLCALAWLAWRRRVSALTVSAAYVLYLLLTPQVYPWYTLFLVPILFLALHESGGHRRVYALIVLQCLLELTYFVGSPLAYNAPAVRKEWGAQMFMAVELLATVAGWWWFSGPGNRRAEQAMPVGLQGERDTPQP
jgi:alpha-1,6-mannosyltransferase